MASETRDPETRLDEQPMGAAEPTVVAERPAWRTGMTAGLAGGLVMGLVFSIWMTPAIESAIPALVGLSGGLAGWFVHMSISAVFGVVFAAAVTTLDRSAQGATRIVAGALVYGAALWAVAAAYVMPFWLDVVGFANAPPLGNFDPTSLAAHLAFGAVLGLTYVYLGRERETSIPGTEELTE